MEREFDSSNDSLHSLESQDRDIRDDEKESIGSSMNKEEDLISEEEFAQHDCHLSPESSCEVCEEYFEQQFNKKYSAGEFDDQYILDDQLADYEDAYVVEQLDQRLKEIQDGK